MCGVDVPRVFHWSVVSGGLAAALAGIMAAFYYGNMSFGTGLIFGLKILFITAVGGYNTPPRAAAGAAMLRHGRVALVRLFPAGVARRGMFALLVALLVLQAVGRRRDEGRLIPDTLVQAGRRRHALRCSPNRRLLLTRADPAGIA